MRVYRWVFVSALGAGLTVGACSVVNSPEDPGTTTSSVGGTTSVGGGGGTPTGTGGGTTTGTATGTPTGSGGTGGDPGCGGGLEDCGGDCVDLQTDMDHCGQCFDDCDPVQESCVTGSCTCNAPLVGCDGGCIDPLTDDLHCGASGDCQGSNAGVDCPPSAPCVDGACTGLRLLVNERNASQIHEWDVAANTFTAFHSTATNDAECNAAEGSSHGWVVNHGSDYFARFVVGSGTGLNQQWATPYAYPKHVTVFNNNVVVMSRNDATLQRYDSNGNVIGSVSTGQTVGQGMATDGTDLYASFWTGSVSQFQRYNGSFVLQQTIANPSGLGSNNNVVDIAYDVTTNSFYGLATIGEGGTVTESNTVVRFQMGGAVLSTHSLPFMADGIGQSACP